VRMFRPVRRVVVPPCVRASRTSYIVWSRSPRGGTGAKSAVSDCILSLARLHILLMECVSNWSLYGWSHQLRYCTSSQVSSEPFASVYRLAM